MSTMNQTEAGVPLAIIALRARQARNEIFGSRIFGDPAWDIMLAIKARGAVTRTQVPELIGLTDNLVDRWVAILEEHGLLRQVGERLELSDNALQKLNRVFDLAITAPQEP